LQRRETAEREEGHKSNAQIRQLVEQRLVLAMDQVVVVLHTDDLRDAAPCLSWVEVTLLKPRWRIRPWR